MSPETGANDRERLIAAAGDVGRGCALTTLTTAAAFASFTASDLDSFFRFGAIASFGTIACLIATFSLLPLVALATGAASSSAATPSPRWDPALAAITRFSAERWRTVLAVSAILAIVSTYGWAVLLKVDNDWTDTFGQKSQTFEWIEFSAKHFAALENLDVVVALPPTVTIEEPSVLEILEKFSMQVEEVENVARSFSILEIIKRTNQALHGSSHGSYTYAATRGGNAEILELASFDDPDGVSPFMTIDRRSVRLSFDVVLLSYSEQREVVTNVERLIDETLPKDWTIQLTGASPVNQAWVAAVQSTQIRSFPIAFALVFVITTFAFRSVRYGLVAMVPTLVPVAMTMGAMGWMGFGLDVGRAMVAAVMIGVGVDDAIHFLAGRIALRSIAGAKLEKRSNPRSATTGRALITTSIALALGFLTLMASAWQTISSFGFFVSLTVVSALVSTLFLLPAVLLGLQRATVRDV